MKNTDRSFPDWLNLDIKGLSPTKRRALYFNIMFPGMGFVYAGDWFRGIVFGLSAVIVLGLGIKLVLAHFLVALALFASVLLIHIVSIWMTPSARVKHPSTFRAVVFLLIAMSFLGWMMILFFMSLLKGLQL